jgi:predicted nucleotidyltransferase
MIAKASATSTALPLDAVASRVREHYGVRLVSLVVFGSRGRGTARPDSDLDLLIVADRLPAGRMARVAEFAAVETLLVADGALGIGAVQCSPVFKSRDEATAGSPLFLDMVDDGQILYDRDGFFANVLERLRARLATLGARRIWRGNAWFWDLKPDYVPGEVFEL